MSETIGVLNTNMLKILKELLAFVHMQEQAGDNNFYTKNRIAELLSHMLRNLHRHIIGC